MDEIKQKEIQKLTFEKRLDRQNYDKNWSFI